MRIIGVLDEKMSIPMSRRAGPWSRRNIAL